MKVKYPVKIGYKDGSGIEENIISDAKDEVLVRGHGDCCGIGGIHNKEVAEAIVKLFNKYKPF